MNLIIKRLSDEVESLKGTHIIYVQTEVGTNIKAMISKSGSTLSEDVEKLNRNMISKKLYILTFNGANLYLLNDDVHSFDEVVFTLQRYLAYPQTQGRSISDLVHRRGECDIKSGDYYDLELLKEALESFGFKVRLDRNYEEY